MHRKRKDKTGGKAVRKRVNRYRDLEAQGYGDKTTIWRGVKDGRFPPPVDILGRPAWLDETLDEYDRNAATIEYPAA